MPASQGRSSVGAASIGGLPSGRSVPARTSTVRVPAPVSHARSTASRTVTPRRSSACTSAGSRSEGAITTTHLGVGAGRRRRRARRCSSGCLSTTPDGSSWQPGATSRPHRITMPGPCHSSSRLGDVPAGGPRAVGGLGGSSRSPMTSTRRPRATGTRAVRPPAVPARFPPPVSTSAPISRPSCHLRGARLLPTEGNRRLRGNAVGAVRLVVRARHRDQRRTGSTGRGAPTATGVAPAAGRP